MKQISIDLLVGGQRRQRPNRSIPDWYYVIVCACHPWHWTHRISNSNSVFLFYSDYFVRLSFGNGLCHFVLFRFVVAVYICFRFDYAGKLCLTTFDWLKCQYGFMFILAIVVNSNQCHTLAHNREIERESFTLCQKHFLNFHFIFHPFYPMIFDATK